ncbi:MAG: SIMPL domain-containing protein [Patescibacteria group bacterium]
MQIFENKAIQNAGLVLMAILCVYFGVKVFYEVKSFSLLGENKEPTVMSFSGHGEVKAVPDIASIYFTIESSKSTQKESSDEVNSKTKNILDFLASSGVDQKDIKTEGYNSYPKYSNPAPCPMYYPANGIMPPCQNTESKIIGYTVSQSVSVKIRKVDDVSKVIDGINKIGVTNMSGPNFTIDDEDSLKIDARTKAISDAKTKAEELAKELGVSLGKITSFNENGNYPMPMYAKGIATMSADSASVPSEIPKGENTITSDVTITYEIR